MTRPIERPPFGWREDPDVPAFDDDGPFVVMDAECAVCARGARLIHRFDRTGEVRIATAQSAVGRGLLSYFGLNADDPESWLYVVDGRAYGSLDAMARIGARYGGPLRATLAFRLLPPGVSDWIYRRIARNRYAVFGRADLCAIPDPGLQARIIK